MYDYMTYRKVLAILLNLKGAVATTPAELSVNSFEDANNDICVTSYEIDSNHFPVYLLWASFKTNKEQELPEFFFRMNEDTCEVGSENGKMELEKGGDWRTMITLFCKKVSKRI